jgi:hypothetical protein
VQTVVPQPIGGDPCQSNAPRGYNYIIDPLKGGSPDGVTAKFLDSNGVSVELATGGTSTTGDGVNTIMVRRQTVLPVGSLTVDTKATDNDILDCDSGTCTNGHISACRAGVGTCPVRRTWRELFLRDGS